jgi:hypothetical protein
MRYLLLLAVFLAATATQTPTPTPKPKKPTETCFYRSEEVDGRNKICYYDCVSGKAAITISSVSLCALSIKRETR